MTTTVMDLLDSLHTYLTTFDLPAPCSVTVMTYSAQPNITIQLPRHEPPAITAALLAWADTLTDVTAEAWRVPTGNSVHLSVIGQLPGGACIQVYGAMPVTDHGPGCDLAPDSRTTLAPAALRQLATLGEVHAR
jgi:hypothetical protein